VPRKLMSVVTAVMFLGAFVAMVNGAAQSAASCEAERQMAFLQRANQEETSAKEVDWAVFLPSGKGQIQVGSYCTICHDLKTTVSVRRTDAAGWKAIVEDMVYSKGTPAPEEDIPVIADYLAAHFGPATPKLELPVNINTAPKELLALLPGLGDEQVQKIVAARENGAVKDLGALEAVIGKGKASGIKNLISFSNQARKSQ
jgi:cytochrome c5